jgi:hypothetical protein
MARAKIVELEIKRKAEDEFRADCTFEPRINTKSRQMVDSLRSSADSPEKRDPYVRTDHTALLGVTRLH